MHIILFENWKRMFETMYQTAPKYLEWSNCFNRTKAIKYNIIGSLKCGWDDQRNVAKD